MPEKYIGWVVQIMYQDSKGKITHRTIRVRGIANGKVSAADLDKGAPRSFLVDGILAIQPIGSRRPA